MNQHDQLILLAVLGLVGAFLLLLARQAARSREAPAQLVVREEVKPVVADELMVVKVETPIVPVPTSVPQEAQELPRPTKKPKPVAMAATKTPIDAVLALLHEKDSLATAFLLREILDPPVSRRR